MARGFESKSVEAQQEEAARGKVKARPQMTPEQQITLLLRLDDYVKQHDYELWRTKQLNDFAGGVWAQVYAPHYHLIIGPALAVRQVGTCGLILMLLWALLRRPRHIAVVEKPQEAKP